MLLQNCTVLPTDLIDFLNNIMCSTVNEDFTSYMKIIYFNHRQSTKEVMYITYLDCAKSEYRTLYHTQKCDASKSDPESGFFVEGIYDHGSGRGCRREHCGRGGRGGG